MPEMNTTEFVSVSSLVKRVKRRIGARGNSVHKAGSVVIIDDKIYDLTEFEKFCRAVGALEPYEVCERDMG